VTAGRRHPGEFLDTPGTRLAAIDPRDGPQFSHEIYVMIGETRMVVPDGRRRDPS